MAAWLSSIVGGLAGGLVTGMVGFFTLRWQSKQAAMQSVQERRATVRPQVRELADRFVVIERTALRAYEDDSLPPFDGESDEQLDRSLQRLILEIPDRQTRDRLDTVISALGRAPFLAHEQSVNLSEFVAQTARLGVEVAGAWLREEVVLDSLWTRQLDALAEAEAAADRHLAERTNRHGV